METRFAFNAEGTDALLADLESTFGFEADPRAVENVRGMSDRMLLGTLGAGLADVAGREPGSDDWFQSTYATAMLCREAFARDLL